MSPKKFILVGAKTESNIAKQYGGVLTLSNGLVDYARRAGFDVEVINTLRSGFDRKSLWERIKSGIGHAHQLFLLLRRGRYHGVIIFSGAGWSFYERVLLSVICRLFRVPDLFFIVDGWFLDHRKDSFLRRHWIVFLLKIPYKLAASGSNWVSFFKELGVEDDQLVTIRYWLPRVLRVVEEPKGCPVGEPLRFIFVGWMIKEKGLDEILNSLETLLKEHRFHFTFIGGGTLLESVRERVKTSKWEESVSVLGWVSSEELERELSAAQVFVLPSYAEGFPMSFIEAMTKGMPAICTDVGGISDSLQDRVNGFLIPARNAEALKKAMAFYLCHPEAISLHSSATLEIVKANHDADINCRLLFNSFSGIE
jgi:glycosyltransferase involved in cell wall biosynthesis